MFLCPPWRSASSPHHCFLQLNLTAMLSLSPICCWYSYVYHLILLLSFCIIIISLLDVIILFVVVAFLLLVNPQLKVWNFDICREGSPCVLVPWFQHQQLFSFSIHEYAWYGIKSEETVFFSNIIAYAELPFFSWFLSIMVTYIKGSVRLRDRKNMKKK